MKKGWPIPVILAMLALGAWRMNADDGQAKKDEHIKLVLKSDQDGSANTLEINDLASLSLGESRDYTSDTGKRATVTREEHGYRLEFDGKVMHIGGDDDVVTLKKGHASVTVNGDGESKTIVAKVRAHGRDGESLAYAFKTTGDKLDVEAVIRDVEKSEEFLKMDRGTQENVRKALRGLKDKSLDENGSGKTVVIEIEKDK